jgi:flagellar biosynthesis protein FlhF
MQAKTMQVKRFVAADMRRALELVRQELGPEAIILSSGRVPEGVELLTTMGSDSELMAMQRQPLGKMAFANASPMVSDGAWSGAGVIERAAQKHADEIEQARLKKLASQRQAGVAKTIPVPVETKKQTSIETKKQTSALSESQHYKNHNLQLEELQADIADMRFLLEQQLDRLIGAPKAGTPVGTPIMGIVARRLERLGLPSDVVNKITSACKKVSHLGDAWPDALANLAHQIPINGRDIIDQGGVFAFVGPTGVGKTTTIGKLAARYVLKHGADKVALITADTYRIAAHDQLRSIARILRVPVRVVDESNSLESLLRSLRHCSLVLIDTAGFRHGDPHLKAQLATLAAQPQVKSYLVLACNSQEQMLKASVHAYANAKLQGCVLTKLDETASMGEALGVIMQNRLPIVYTTDGQDIPNNIDIARAHQLVAKTVALLKKNPASAVS